MGRLNDQTNSDHYITDLQEVAAHPFEGVLGTEILKILTDFDISDESQRCRQGGRVQM
jgi:hypothetical protein